MFTLFELSNIDIIFDWMITLDSLHLSEIFNFFPVSES